jgi:heterodisulfide reductase subunit A
MSRIGVFVCHCGENIGRTVDCVTVAKKAASLRDVVFSTEYKYLCSDPGQTIIKDAIKNYNLSGVVIGSCSPLMHEKTFRRAVESAGMNPFLCEIANIREHCSWVHEDKEQATEKALDLIRIMVEKVKRNLPLAPIRIPVTKRALVIGGGVAGIQAALDIADGGQEVILVEKSPSIGGHMAQLSETFPTLDCSQCILTPKMVSANTHKNIKVYAYSEVESVSGYIGNFEVTIKRKASYVDNSVCTGCGICQEKCPIKKIPSEFNTGLGTRKAIYVPFPQAVPNKPVIDAEYCTHFKTGKCGLCEKMCGPKAIRWDQTDQFIKEEIGAIVVATGYELYKIDKKPTDSEIKGYGEYGYGKYPDVIDGLQFERILSASGPTFGEVKRPSDGKVPETVVFIQCVGSRDEAKGVSYCSKICCMYTAKHTMLYKHKVHNGKAIVFYMDIRSGGKNYDEFVRRAIEEDGAIYLRGRVSKISQQGDKLLVKGADTLSGAQVEIEADLVVLATAIAAQPDIVPLAQKLGVGYDKYKFLSEAHPKLRPVETNSAGIYLAGACQAPKDIPEAVAQASAAASKVLGLFSSFDLEREPYVARVNETTCVDCEFCITACPYAAIARKEIKNRAGQVIRIVANVNEGKCQGCGTCVSICRSKSLDLAGFTDQQVYAEINALFI